MNGKDQAHINVAAPQQNQMIKEQRVQHVKQDNSKQDCEKDRKNIDRIEPKIIEEEKGRKSMRHEPAP